jgi:hypothetical protein
MNASAAARRPLNDAATALTHVELTWLEKRIEHYRSDGPQPAVDERGRLHGASGLAAKEWINRAAHQRARRIAQQRKFGYPSEQETKMAGTKKATPIKTAR